jgi:hypothetical protein
VGGSNGAANSDPSRLEFGSAKHRGTTGDARGEYAPAPSFGVQMCALPAVSSLLNTRRLTPFVSALPRPKNEVRAGENSTLTELQVESVKGLFKTALTVWCLMKSTLKSDSYWSPPTGGRT